MQPESFTSAFSGKGDFPATPPRTPTATSPPASTTATPAGPTTAQVFLGLFILWQLFFLFAANFLAMANTVREDEDYQKVLPKDAVATIDQYLPGWLRKEGHIHDACDVLSKVTGRWEELAGLPQNWSLFAPEISTETSFVAVQLRWDEPSDDEEHGKGKMAPFPPELLLSENEPQDKASFFRLGKFRLRKYESNIDLVLTIRENEDSKDNEKVKKKETLEEAAERWGRRIKKKVTREWDTIPAYLKMRWNAYRKEHPDRPSPRQIVLLVRTFSIPPPADFSEKWYRDPIVVPMACCRIDADGKWQRVEWFKPKVGKDKQITGHYRYVHGGDDDEDD